VSKTIYLAGKMSGVKEFNFPAFHAEAARLRAEGHTVFNPAEADMERHGGVDISKGNDAGSVDQATAEHNFSRADAIRQDLNWIIDNATTIVILPHSSHSRGVKVEKALAEFLDLEIIEL
jgi:Domain of unknown function (DUF4406)